MCHTAAYYFFGKDPTFALVLLGPVRPQCAAAECLVPGSRRPGAAQRVRQEVQLYGIAGGNTGTQMGGWFRKEIKTVDDLKGLKMRIGGCAGKTLHKLGVVPQQIAGGDIYPALEKGTIDATEWVGPYDDEKLGFYKVAKYYYYPGWWEGGTVLHFYINPTNGTRCRRPIRRSSRCGCRLRQHRCAGAIRRAQSAGAQAAGRGRGAVCGRSARQIMEACLKASNEVMPETSATNPDFKKCWIRDRRSATTSTCGGRWRNTASTPS